MADRRRLEQVGRDLVQERLEGVEVVLVHEHDVDLGVGERARRADPGEASAEDEHARAGGRGVVLLRHRGGP